MARYPLRYRAIDRVRGYGTVVWWRALTDGRPVDRESLVGEQEARLRELIRRAAARVPFYREFFKDSGIDPGDIRSVGDLRVLPVVTKKMLRENPEKFRSDDFDAIRKIGRSTSGSTGEPFRYHIDADAWGFVRAFRLFCWSRFGYRPGDLYLTLSGSSLFSGGDASLSMRLYNLMDGRKILPIENLTDNAMNRLVVRLTTGRPVFLFGYPSVLYEFARYILDGNLTVHSVRKVITTSECFTPAQREAIERAFRARVYDFYGCGEGTVVACECAQHRGLHYGMEGALLETVDPDTLEARDTGPGRILATSLLNRCLPFIRYDTGDIATIDRSPCPCGLPHDRLSDIQGRDRDLVVLGDGRKIHGSVINSFFSKHAWIGRFQVIQEAPDRVEVLVEPRNGSPNSDAGDFQKELERFFEGVSVRFLITRHFHITASGKFLTVVSHRK